MPSFEHRRLIERIARLNEPPHERAAYADWVKARDQLSFLEQNAAEDELVVYASGRYFFVHAVVVLDQRLVPIDEDDLLSWSCNPYRSLAGYVWGGEQPDVWIERGLHNAGTAAFEDAQQLVFGRSFEGLKDDDANYFEILQEYTHLTGIHWRPEQHAYCRFNEHGDFEPVVSITYGRGEHGVRLVSFKREPLEQYLTASGCTLVRLFDFTIYKPESFSGWHHEEEKRFHTSDDFLYRQAVGGRDAAYTRGVQIVRPHRTSAQVSSAMKGQWSGRPKRYVEFIAHDWRNRRLARISTAPEATTNYFQAQSNSLPFEVSPAFFRPEVLLKYKTDRDKYTVDLREIHCRGAWTLRNYDINEAGQIHTYICYLRNLPYEEQLYWASYNEEPKAPISRRALTTDFEGVPYPHTDPLQSILATVRRLSGSGVAWWKLRDDTLAERVNIPRTTSRDEWAEAFMDLSKLIIEGFETKEIRQRLVNEGITFDLKDQSIVLIEKLMAGRLSSPGGDRLTGLRTVQQIRSKAKGHSGGRQGTELAKNALKEHGSYGAHFEHICSLVVDELEAIERITSATAPAQVSSSPGLAEGYRAMAADEEREREAAEWIEGLTGDIADDKK